MGKQKTKADSIQQVSSISELGGGRKEQGEQYITNIPY